MTSPTFEGDPEALRITRVVHAAADTAFQSRVADAMALRFMQTMPEEIDRRRRDQGISDERWEALSRSTREAASPEEFRAFARALSVSPRWLAVGSGSPIDPPAGWHQFGSHVDQPGVLLDFSEEVDEVLMPLWERPRQQAAA